MNMPFAWVEVRDIPLPLYILGGIHDVQKPVRRSDLWQEGISMNRWVLWYYKVNQKKRNAGRCRLGGRIR
jgi:hypothetical protein